MFEKEQFTAESAEFAENSRGAGSAPLLSAVSAISAVNRFSAPLRATGRKRNETFLP
jgi:hypothetical protein